jgi:hypothetical protein
MLFNYFLVILQYKLEIKKEKKLSWAPVPMLVIIARWEAGDQED